ncbi:MAG: Clp protease N-terminal domain-containing protein [Nakamurella sp.]
MFERFAASTRDAVNASAAEARQRGDRRIGTDHLLLGLLHDPGSAGVLGVTVQTARESSTRLDRQALAAIGIDLAGYTPTPKLRAGIRAPFTSGARSVIARTLSLTTAERAKKMAPRHLLLALLEREQPDPAAALLTELGVDRSAVQKRLAQQAT